MESKESLTKSSRNVRKQCLLLTLSAAYVYSPVQLPVVRTEDWGNLASDPQMSRDEDRCSMEELIRILLSSGILKL